MRKSVHTPEYASLKDELRSARAAAGLSQRELAVALKVPPSVIAKIESGERRTDVIEFCWFVRACGADPIPPLERIARKVLEQRASAKKPSRTR